MIIRQFLGTPTFIKRLFAAILLLIVLAVGFSVFAALQVLELAYTTGFSTDVVEVVSAPTPFPIGVDPGNKLIIEDPQFSLFHTSEIAIEEKPLSWWQKLSQKLAQHHWFQNLASPISRMIVVLPGERKEEVVDNFGDILRWNEAERQKFTNLIDEKDPELSEGKYYPGNYIFTISSSPEVVAAEMNERFNQAVLRRYTQDVATAVPLQDALVIASLLEREARDFSNMREISGVIWNRLFIDMNLQLDASLQYAKGSLITTPSWWPQVVPRDKFITSEFNTYQNSGLPPAPISNPSSEAIVAALNPVETKCLFYFHDSSANYYCSETYEEHVTKLRDVYGRGR